MRFYNCPSQTCDYTKLMDIDCMDTIICNKCKRRFTRHDWSVNKGESVGDWILEEEEEEKKKKKKGKKKKKKKKGSH